MQKKKKMIALGFSQIFIPRCALRPRKNNGTNKLL